MKPSLQQLIEWIETKEHESPSNTPFYSGYEHALNAVKEKIAELIKVDDWISVEEELPKSREQVLCYTYPYRTQIQNSWEEHTDQDKEWFKRLFSHWRKLHPSPKPTAKIFQATKLI